MFFREKFIKYLTDGIPVHIPEDEVFLFYNALKDFIDNADNQFMAFYSDGDEELMISDIGKDYLRVSYDNEKIVFRQPLQDDVHQESQGNLLITGQAFLGVVMFIETISPSEDSNFIESIRHDTRKF
tara:strand:+ start:519 stop:899 length:381 start_codon:yes stop_codon:yes gene_type:complete